MTFIKRMMGLCGVTAALALASGCGDYTYFNVGVYVNQLGDHPVNGADQDKIGSCTLAVFAGDKQIELSTQLHRVNGTSNICSPGSVPNAPSKDNVEGTRVRDLGVLDYSTARDSGTLKFVVTFHDATTDEPDLAQGSVEGKISQGKVLDLKLIANSCKTSSGKYECPVTGIN